MSASPISLLPNVFGSDYSSIPTAIWKQLRIAGVTSLELGATSDPFPPALIGQLRDLGFTFLGHGSSLWALQQELPRFIADAQARGETHLLCYWPWLDAADHISRSQVSASASLLQTLGQRCRDAHLRFSFHNHGIEFRLLDGETICDHLLRETDPDFVSLELDLYHVLNTGFDPLPFLERHRDRISILHLNAMDGAAGAGRVGDGMPHFETLLRSVPGAHWVIEGQQQDDPLRYVQASHRHLTSLLAPADPATPGPAD